MNGQPFRKREVALSRNYVVSQLDDSFSVGLVTDFRTAEHNLDVGSQPFEIGDEFCRRFDIPDVNAEADDLRILSKNLRQDVGRVFAHPEFEHRRLRAKVAHIRQQVTQPECRVPVPSVERGKDNIRHWSTGAVLLVG